MTLLLLIPVFVHFLRVCGLLTDVNVMMWYMKRGGDDVLECGSLNLVSFIENGIFVVIDIVRRELCPNILRHVLA